MNETELLELKQEITEAKTKEAELKGQRTLLTKQLKEKWGVSTTKEGKAKLESLQLSIDKKDEEIKTATTKLEEQLDEDNNAND